MHRDGAPRRNARTGSQTARASGLPPKRLIFRQHGSECPVGASERRGRPGAWVPARYWCGHCTCAGSLAERDVGARHDAAGWRWSLHPAPAALRAGILVRGPRRLARCQVEALFLNDEHAFVAAVRCPEAVNGGPRGALGGRGAHAWRAVSGSVPAERASAYGLTAWPLPRPVLVPAWSARACAWFRYDRVPSGCNVAERSPPDKLVVVQLAPESGSGQSGGETAAWMSGGVGSTGVAGRCPDVPALDLVLLPAAMPMLAVVMAVRRSPGATAPGRPAALCAAEMARIRRIRH